MKRRVVSILLICAVFLGLFPPSGYAVAISAQEMQAKFAALQKQYKQGSIWTQGYYPSGAGFDGAWECYGFARLVYRTLFNESERNSYLHRNVDDLCVGDHIRYNVKTKLDHSILVTNIIGDKVYYVDCNGTDMNGRNWVNCMVRWDKYYTKSQIKNLISKKLQATARVPNGNGYISTQKDNWVRTLNPVVTPSTPSSVNLSSGHLATGDSLTASWGAVSGATGYDVTLSCSTNSAYNQKTSVTGSKATFILNHPGTYTVSVSAKNSAGSSGAKTSGQAVVHPDCTVTFKDYDGRLLGTKTVKYNGTVSAPLVSGREGYTFQGWSGALNNITTDKTVVANYTINTYTVKFVDNEGQVLNTQRVTYGSSATEPDAPVPPAGYMFVGWDKEDYKCVSKDLTITAVFAWENKDLPIVAEITSALRDTAAQGYEVTVDLLNYPDALTRGKIITTLKTEAGKMVASETETFHLAADATTSRTVYIPYSGVATVAEVSVVGVVDDGNTGVPIANAVKAVVDLGLQWSDWSVNEPPEGDYIVESRTEYRYKSKETTTSPFMGKSGWTRYDSQITSWGNWSAWQNTAVTASTTRQVKTQTIPAKYKTVHKYSRYENSAGTYSGWSSDYYSGYLCNVYREITRDSALTKIWDADNNRYRYGPDATHGTYLKNYWWNYWTAQVQTSAAYTQYSYRDAIYTHYFYRWSDWSDWQAESVEATDDRQVESRTVYRFKSNDIKIPTYNYKRYKYQNLNDGNYYYSYASTYADSMAYPGEWEYNKAYAELSVVETVENGIQIYNGYGEDSWYRADINTMGDSSTYIIYDTLEDTSGKTYTLSGAVNAPNKKATLMLYKGTNTDPTASQLEYVEQITLGENGEYSFVFNPKEIPSIKTGDFIAVLGIEGGTTPIYIGTIEAPKPTYTVEFVDEDGTLLDKQIIIEGSSAVLPESNPQKEGYDFIGWDTGITNIHSDLTIMAQYQKKTYTVVFVDWENNDIAIKTFEHGDSLEGPSPLEKDGSTFVGWDKVLEGTLTVTDNMVVTAEYALNTYTISFANWDGEIIDTQTLEYGEEAVFPEEPTMENMVFAGWSDSQLLLFASEDVTVYPVFEYPETCAAPTANITSGSYSRTQTVTLSCSNADAVIYYSTLDGQGDILDTMNMDELEWLTYTGPIEVAESSTLVFYAACEEMNNSAYQVESYTIRGSYLAEITGSTLARSNGTISGKLYYNVTGEGNSASAVPILAIYNSEGALVSMTHYDSITLNEGDNTGSISDISFSDTTGDTYMIQLFFWDSLVHLRPVSGTGTLRFN